jgi:hypothetical protein
LIQQMVSEYQHLLRKEDSVLALLPQSSTSLPKDLLPNNCQRLGLQNVGSRFLR